MQAICIYCGSRPGNRPIYRETAVLLGTLLAERNLTLVYGGGSVGLMGVVADAALAAGGRVVGVIPDALMKAEVGHANLTELHVVPNMHARKQMMADLADAFIAMPGGIGTYEELFETFTWLQLGYHKKPIGLLNVDGYYDPLLDFMRHAISEDFLSATHASLLTVSDEPEHLVDTLTWRPHQADPWPALREKT